MSIKKQSKVSAEFNMSSLTDIIFLLLIFFMLTSSVVNPFAINLKLPSSSSQKPVANENPFRLSISSTLRIALNGVEISSADNVAEHLSQAVYASGRKPQDVTVILEVDDQVDAQTLVSVVDGLNEVGVKMILAVQTSS